MGKKKLISGVNMNDKKLKSKVGFTLIELLIAMSIISLIAMAFFTVWNSTIKANTKNEKDIKALNIAQSEIENVRNQIKKDIDNPIKNIKVSSYQVTSDSYINQKVIIDGSTPSYKKKIEGDANLYTVNLNVSKRLIECSSSNYIYTIHVSVESDNKNFSKKVTELQTEVFGK